MGGKNYYEIWKNDFSSSSQRENDEYEHNKALSAVWKLPFDDHDEKMINVDTKKLMRKGDRWAGGTGSEAWHVLNIEKKQFSILNRQIIRIRPFYIIYMCITHGCWHVNRCVPIYCISVTRYTDHGFTQIYLHMARARFFWFSKFLTHTHTTFYNIDRTTAKAAN